MTRQEDTPASPGGSEQQPTDFEQPRQIGPYRILDVLGEGGMAVVYLAEQSEPVTRQVALKIVKPGMDSHQVVARFESERQALAVLDHPNIAKVFDGGITENGRPYFVMERVKGLPVTDYCDDYKLGTQDRLRLFIDICSAVQHAHHKGLIHRDLKPSNILVAEADGKPQPKIIDFGIAKATGSSLTDKTLFTRVGQIIGTPQYMSPEQADFSGLDVDTRADVYSLGIVLYEMLVGVPMDLAALGDIAMRMALFEKDAARPSAKITELGDTGVEIARARGTNPETLQRQLKGDLDWVVMKAIAKDRARRYETVNALALECDRYLKHQPVLARPPSAGYLLQRFVRRNRVTVTAVGLVFAMLVVAVAGTSWGMIRAQRAEQRAGQEASIAQAVNEFLNVDLLSAVAPSVKRGRGKDVPMREVLDVAAQRIEEASRSGGRFADTPRVEAAIRTTLGLTYHSLGEYAAAEPHLRAALRIYEQHPGEDQKDLALAQGNMGGLALRLGHYDVAERYYSDALATWPASLGAENAKPITWMTSRASVIGRQGRTAEAEAMLLEALSQAKAQFGDGGSETLNPMVTLANVYQEVGENDKAETLWLDAMKVQEQHFGPESLEMMTALNNLANVYAGQGKLTQAAPLWTRALELKTRVLGAEHPSTLNTLYNLATMQELLGNYERAEVLFQEVFEIRARTLGAEHPRTLLTLTRLAHQTAKQGRLDEAEALATQAARQLADTLGRDHPYALENDDVLAMILLDQGRVDEAAELLRRARATLATSYPEDTKNRTLFGAHLGLAMAQLGDREEAEALWNETGVDLPSGDAETNRILEAVIGFLEQWEEQNPGHGFGARAVEWRERLADLASVGPT